ALARCWCWSNGVAPALASANADDFVDGKHEDLPVADAAGLGRLLDRLHHLHHLFVADDDLELHLGQEVDDIFGAPIELGVAFLSPEPLHLADGEALNADSRQTLLHLVQLEGLDDRLDFFHVVPPVRAARTQGFPLLEGISACKPVIGHAGSTLFHPQCRCTAAAPIGSYDWAAAPIT